jgi:hypothetical protein
MSKKWEKIGEIGVDAGLCWLGDPCYVLHREPGDVPKAIGANWRDFVRALDGDTKQFNYDLGHAGLGVAVSTGYGDGTYPVEIQRSDDGHIAAVRIVFIPDEPNERG